MSTNADAVREFRRRRREQGLCRDCGQPSETVRCNSCYRKEHKPKPPSRTPYEYRYATVKDLDEEKLERAMHLVDVLVRMRA